MEFVGINCAACHVGELRHDGKAVRVDGAPNMFNMQLFYSQAVEALMATTSDRGKLWRALKRLGRQDYGRYGVAAPFVRPATLVYYGANVLLHRDRLDARLELIAVIRAAKEQRDPKHPTSGFGRLDAFDGTRNFMFTRLRKADAERSFRGQHGEHGQARRGGEVPAALVAQGFGRRSRSRPTASNPGASRRSGASRITTGSNGPSTPTR